MKLPVVEPTVVEPTRDLYLRKGADKRVRGGHLWVYSNEVDTKRSSLGSYSAGDGVHIRDSGGEILASAYMEPKSLICARIYAPGAAHPFDLSMIHSHLDCALEGREEAFDRPYYRLVFGDSDLLPGLVVDRFGEYLVMQLNNAGIERYEQIIVDALVGLLAPRGILLRADSRARREQGLGSRIEAVYGDVPQEIELWENGVSFLAPVWAGQKTGWFYDHRMSRARLATYAPGRSVLDVYSYIGGWGVQAAAFGAADVCCLDSSAPALDRVMDNARRNNVSDKVTTRLGSAPETMAAMAAEGCEYDLVILDPPAFIQRRKDIKKGIAAYRRINELGLRLLRPGGLLVSASCSMHLSRSDLLFAMASAANRVGAQLRVIEQGAQGADHPIHPAIPETEYLKAVFARRL